MRGEDVMNVQVWIGKSRIAGKGLFAGQDIKKGMTILRYIGTKISKEQTARELAKGNAYICYLNDRYDIDGNKMISPRRARYSRAASSREPYARSAGLGSSRPVGWQ